MQKLLFFAVFSLALLFSACRDDVIDPNNPVTNVNEPVQTRTSQSYSFSINAFAIDKNVVNTTDIYSSRNRILITADNYKEGSVNVVVTDQYNSNVYEMRVSSDESGIYASLIGSIPQRIMLTFSNFTGRFKIEISPLY